MYYSNYSTLWVSMIREALRWSKVSKKILLLIVDTFNYIDMGVGHIDTYVVATELISYTIHAGKSVQVFSVIKINLQKKLQKIVRVIQC
jgi:hypothetical protein